MEFRKKGIVNLKRKVERFPCRTCGDKKADKATVQRCNDLRENGWDHTNSGYAHKDNAFSAVIKCSWYRGHLRLADAERIQNNPATQLWYYFGGIHKLDDKENEFYCYFNASRGRVDNVKVVAITPKNERRKSLKLEVETF